MQAMNGPIPVGNITAGQRADLAALLAQEFTLGNIEELGTRVLEGTEVRAIVANQPTRVGVAALLIEKMHAAGRLPEILAILKTEVSRNARFLRGLNHILAGARLATLQATVQAREDPFLDNDFLEVHFPRVQRTVCAIGLGVGVNRLMGTGFLIGPDLVMTNFHVVGDYVGKEADGTLIVEADGTIRTTATGDNIYCFFDYLAAPAPQVPPNGAGAGVHASVLVKAAQNGWLLRARDRLANEGTPPYATAEQALGKYDYAIIKLEREIGNVPSRKSGGAPRGWLNLASGVDYAMNGTRIVVLQHPQGSHQLFDIGEFSAFDPSKTRIWYTVNTDYGSSGGAAIDKLGRLYALHNASVKGQQQLVNQGVRIDMILDDLRQPPSWTPAPPPADGDLGYWSLSDNIGDPRPIIGRQFFRQSIRKVIAAKDKERVLAVVGPKGSGRRFSVDLLKRVVGANVPIVRFPQQLLESLSPRDFVKALATQLALPLVLETGEAIPDPKRTEQESRWISVDLSTWLAKNLKASQEKYPSRYPAWVVIDAVVDGPNFLSWADNLPDLISALSGGPDPGQAGVDIPQLRWLMLSSEASMLPPTRAGRIVDDLTVPDNVKYDEDFANCLSLAWRSLEASEQSPHQLLKKVGLKVIKDATRDQKNLRASLAEFVRDTILG
jgi:hypothetical protein